MKVVEESLAQATVVSLAGRLDAATSPEIDERYVGAALPHKNLVMDCSALDFLSSAGLRVMLRLHKKLGEAGGVLALCAPGPNVKEVLELSGMAAFLKVYDTREQALAALQALG